RPVCRGRRGGYRPQDTGAKGPRASLGAADQVLDREVDLVALLDLALQAVLDGAALEFDGELVVVAAGVAAEAGFVLLVAEVADLARARAAGRFLLHRVPVADAAVAGEVDDVDVDEAVAHHEAAAVAAPGVREDEEHAAVVFERGALAERLHAGGLIGGDFEV